MRLKLLQKQVYSLALTAAMTVSTVAQGFVPVSAEKKDTLPAEYNGIQYLFTDSYGQGLSSVDLSGQSEISDEDILSALDESSGDVDVYAIHPDFYDANGENVTLEHALDLSIDSENLREDKSNVQIFALPKDTDLSSLQDYKIESTVSNDEVSWELDPETNTMITVIGKLQDQTVSMDNAELTFSGMNRNAEMTVKDESDSSLSMQIALDNVKYLPESISISGDGWEEAPAISLFTNDSFVKLSGEADGNTAKYSLSSKAVKMLNRTMENGSVSFSIAENTSDEDRNQIAEQNVKRAPSKATQEENDSDNAPAQAGTVTLHEGSTTQKEISLGDNEYFLADKYITEQGNVINGQKTYLTTIEHAAYSNKIIRIQPPKKREILIAIDSSASMGDKVDSMNEAIDAFVKNVAETNQLRKKRWDSGYYYGTEGDTVDNHLLTIRAIVKYNNKVTTLVGSPITPMSTDDVAKITGPAHLRNGYEPNGSLYDMTRTDLAIAKLQSFIDDPTNSSIVFMTDGEPYGRGNEGALDYDTDTSSGLMMTYENTNDALRTARSIKDNGSTIYTVYVQTGYPNGLIDNAKSSRDIHKLATMPSQTGGNNVLSDQSLGCAFLSMFSSDYPKNGQMHGNPSGNDHIFTGSYDDPGEGTFGRYFKMPEEVTKITDDFVDIAKDIDYSTSFTDGLSGYAGASSYVYDVISYPFNANTDIPIAVSQVPRICTGTDENGNKVYEWGDEEDITNDVSATIENGRYVTVRGYDYEANALSDFNKNLKNGGTETYPSKAGDYGYKLMVKFRIYANRVFGGNGIETNDSTISGFYPSEPLNKTPWKENKELNPNGNDEMLLYPVPIVDLNVSYKLVSDNVVIYAPQTAKLSNLITDKNGRIFATDNSYDGVKKEYEDSKAAADKAMSAYVKAASDFSKAQGTSDEENKKEALENAITAYSDAKTRFADAQKAYDEVESFIPDGDNNAYVDIHYSLKDPDGKELATMDISHGEDDTDGHIGWKYKEKDQLIKKHGNYTITATITPVDTTREESHTGSTAAGSQKEHDFTATPYAHIYVLHMSATDSVVENKEPVGIYEDTVIKVKDIQSTSWLKDSITKGEWVALDGTTPEKNDDIQPEDQGSTIAMGSQPGLILYAPDKTHLSGIDGSYSANGKNGDYIPVTVKMYRQLGDINKDASALDQTNVKNIPMNDDDNRYIGTDGKPVSSVVWEHVCTVVDNCDSTDFLEAGKVNNTMDEDYQVKTRYLIHIRANIVVVPKKRASSSLIKKGTDLDWTITVPNTDAETNPDRLTSDSYLVDVLPYNGDGRTNPDTGEDTGSKFSGSLYYKKVTVDFKDASSALERLKNGTKGVYYTSDTSVREAEKNGNEIRNTKWTKASYTLDGTVATINIPFDAEALRVDTYLPFGDSIYVDMTAAMRSSIDQKIDDVYINQAFEFTGSDRVGSNATKTQVSTSYISGLVWEDTNGNGMQDTGELAIQGVRVGLYVPHNPYGGPSAAITVDGVSYDRAFDADNNSLNDIVTGEDGAYRFENLRAGTYFVIAQNVDKKYTITGKHKVSDTNIDSDAEETMPSITNIGKQNSTDSSKTSRAWIKDIVVSDTDSREHMDIGFLLVTGSIDITKTLDQIYFPSTMTEEEKLQYFPTFHFVLTDASGQRQYKTVQLNERRMSGNCTFTKLPLGTYTLEEESAVNYGLNSISSNDPVTKDLNGRKITFTITADHQDFAVTFANNMTGNPPAGDQNQVINHLPMHIPIKLQVHYTGPSSISDHTKASYTFPADQVKGTVTYDDGSTMEVTLGETSGYTIDPVTITNLMNTGKGNRVAIHGFYTEKGRTLEDSFSVAVDLKPVHKFQLNFDANGATFNDGTRVNSVVFSYDELTNSNFATNGIYKDIPNGLMNGLGAGYTFAGWNTKNDGTGVQYDDFSSLSAIGANTGITSLTLYANWRVNITFDANGGNLSGGVSNAERSIVGRPSGSIQYSLNQNLATALTAIKTNHSFFFWNTKPDGTGTRIDKIGRVTGPLTLYAIYMRTDYQYVNYVEDFTAPVTGEYRLQVWGCQGGGGAYGGRGGYAAGSIHLSAGQKLYVCVGGRANNNYGGYNGGGRNADNSSASGGGATHIAVTNYGLLKNYASHKDDVLLVAGGGGGAKVGDDGEDGWQNVIYYGGYGGGSNGGNGQGDNYGTGASQSSPGGTVGGLMTNMYNYPGFGQGGDATWCGEALGGGGGGWYGGGPASGHLHNGSGGGGSGHVNSSLYDSVLLGGNQLFSSPSGASETGHWGDGYARITLISWDNQ